MKYSIAIALALTAPLAAMAQTTVFSDNFSGASTVQSATPGAGTASSADYEVFTSTAAPTTTPLAANDFNLTGPNTGSGFAEVQARFGGSPVTLATIGDTINLTITFVDTANVLVTGNNVNSTVNVGLFNSGGVNLNQGEQLGGGAVVTGGSQTYQGYVGRLFLNGNANSFNRATQTAAGSSQNQDLLFNAASGTSSFNAPGGTATTGNTGTTGQQAGLTQGNTYTISYTIALTAANAVKVTDQFFNGSTATGTPIVNQSGTSTGGAFLGSTFDSLGFGFRLNTAPNPALAGVLDINNIIVTENLAAPVPEPTTLALSAIGGLGLLAVRRFKNKK
jgi:hypothetical protein